MGDRILYFAYGSNLCAQQMGERCPGSRPSGLAVLKGARLDFPRRSARWGGGVAGWAVEPGSHVEGVLYELSGHHLEALDHIEGVAEGRYRRTIVEVQRVDAIQQAVTYAPQPEPHGPFRPTPGYLEAMIRGARHHGLSAAWIRMLEDLRASPNSDGPNPAGGSTSL